jgi:hypothetical protein
MYISIIIVLIALIAVGIPTTVFANVSQELSEEERESGFWGERDFVTHDRPAINPDFVPNESCNLDVYQIQSIPESELECPEDFGKNDDSCQCK